MIICSCNVISDHDVRNAVVSAEAKPCSTAQVYDCLGGFIQCGRCARTVRRILDECASRLSTMASLPDARLPLSRRTTAFKKECEHAR